MTISTFDRLGAISAAALCLHAGAATAQDKPEDPIKPFLENIAPGPQSAHDMLDLAHTAVTNLQSSQDWLGVIGAGSGGKAKSGFGVAFTPGRSDVRALAVSLGDYADAKKPLKRLWGATTISYARNQAKHDGSDYRQTALFLQTTYYPTATDDPVVAGYEGVKACVKDKEKGAEFNQAVLRRVKAERQRLAGRLSDADFDALEKRIKAEESTTMALLASGAEETRLCAKAAMDAASAKWNTTRAGLAVGQGWLEGGTAGRVSLGQHLSVSAAYAPAGWDDSLFNLTVRQVRREVDLGTLASTPAFRSNTQAALRYTYNAGAARNVFALAEVSTSRKRGITQSNTAFKQALGVDYKVGKSLWIEFRWGRARSADGSGDENRSLLSLKFSPEGQLAQLLGR